LSTLLRSKVERLMTLEPDHGERGGRGAGAAQPGSGRHPIAALVVQDPFRMGYDGVKIALAASKGEQVPASVDTGATVITKANINSARSQELLNPRIK
jgi:ABC-type sugar transport system substrate-binding protein